jgi:HSP20 family protein
MTAAFERFASEAFAGARRSPLVEQDDKSWTLSLDVPGFAREDLSIGIEGAVVRIESKAEAKRQFKAAYELPLDIDVTSPATPNSRTACSRSSSENRCL